MTLRQKTLLIVGGTLTVLIGILYVVSRKVLLRGFGELEEQIMRRDAQRGVNALQNSLADSFEHIIIHTGQHYDFKLSEIFFSEFSLPTPNYNLDVGSTTPCIQIAEMIKKLEHLFQSSKIDIVLVYGDTNSTFAGALAATKSNIHVAHVESGLRSFDRRMPEELNRILTDHISNILYSPTKTALENLKSENIQGEIINTGDISVEVIRDAESKISRLFIFLPIKN